MTETAITITADEWNALARVLHEAVQRPVYERDERVRRETSLIEAFMDRAQKALRASLAAESTTGEGKVLRAEVARLQGELIEAKAR